MESNINLRVDNLALFRWLFVLFAIAVPFIYKWDPDFNSLHVLTIIFLGIGFHNQSKWFLFIMCSAVLIIRSFITDGDGHLSAFLIRLGVYFTVTLISAEVTRQYHEIKKREMELIIALANSLDQRDAYTAGHSQNVARYAYKIAQAMKMSPKQANFIYIGGLLHDIGKIGVPESILKKSAKLTPEEYEIIKSHSSKGYETIKHITAFETNGILDMVLYHHERYDGKGYPHGLKGEEIPLTARIVTIADSFDAMTTRRVYRDELEFEQVIRELETNKGTQFDPEIADVFIAILHKEGRNILTPNPVFKK